MSISFLASPAGIGAAVGALGRIGRAISGNPSLLLPRASVRSGGPKTPNPAGTKLARKARERKLGLRWC